MPIKYFLYARKSTESEDRQVYSIDQQIQVLRQLAASKNFEIVEEFTETRTAASPGRSIFAHMLSRLKAGHAQGIIAWHPDRLARNSIDGGHLVHLIDTGVITHMEFPTFWFEPTPQGMLMLSIAFGMSKYYTDSLAQNVKRGQLQRVKDGHWPWRPPIGYVFDRNKRIIIPDADRAPLVKKAFNLYSTGEYTLDRLTNVMAGLGLSSPALRNLPNAAYARSKIHNMLRNPFYVGLLRHGGELFEGKHQPLISQSVFTRCKDILRQRGRTPSLRYQPFLYRGLFSCGECGCGITLEVKKGIRYLRCCKQKGRCSQPYLREDQAQQQIVAEISKVAVSPETVNGLLRELQRRQRQGLQERSKEIEHLETKLANFQVRLSRITDAYIDGTITPSEYKISKEKILINKQFYTEKLGVLHDPSKNPLEPVIRFIRGLTEPRRVIATGDPVPIRDFYQKLHSNPTIRNRRIHGFPVGAWKSVVGQGDLGTRSAAAARSPLAKNTGNTSCPLRRGASAEHRMGLDRIMACFQDIQVAA